MLKAIIRFIVVVLFVNATWRIASAYLSFHKFSDAVKETAVHSKGDTDDQLKEKVMAQAASYDEPLAADAVAIRRDEHHTYITGSYTKPIAVLPGVEYQWPFSLDVDGFVIVSVKLGDLANPQ